MDTLDITMALRKCTHFKGVFPISDLPVVLLPKPCSVVINLDERWKQGSHWVAVHIPARGPSFYFDSFGRYPPEEIIAFIERQAPNEWSYSGYKLQGDLSNVCGVYCIEFIKACPNYKKFFQLYDNCSVMNDKKLVKRIDP